MAKSSPSFQFYPGDFTRGVLLLSNEEIGIYVLLLCFQWENGRVPIDEKQAAKIANTRPPKLVNVLLKFSQDSEGYFNERLELERKKQLEYREKQKANGQLGGKPKHTQPLTQTEPKPNPSLSSGLTQNKPLQSSVFSLQSSNIVNTDTPPTLDAVLTYAKSPHGGITESVATAFWRNFQAVGWIDAAGRKVTDWKQALHKWSTNQGKHGRNQHTPKSTATTKTDTLDREGISSPKVVF